MRYLRPPKNRNKQPILFIDGMNLCFRNIFSGSNLKSREVNTQVIYGGIKSIQVLIEKFNPSQVIFVLEGKGSRDRRKAIYPAYKAHRKTNLPIDKDEFYNQVSELSEDFLYNLGVGVVKVDTYEADDVIAVMSRANEGSSIIVSTDGDYLQCISEKVTVYNPTKDLLITLRNFKEVVGVNLADFLDWKAMVGDSSDNIKGVVGVGAKTATEICNFMGYTRAIEAGVENVDKKWKKIFSEEAREQFKLADKLINLNLTELTISEINDNLVKGNYDSDEIKDLCEDYNMWSLLDRYDKIEDSYGTLDNTL